MIYHYGFFAYFPRKSKFLSVMRSKLIFLKMYQYQPHVNAVVKAVIRFECGSWNSNSYTVSTFVCTSKMMVKLRFQAEFPVAFWTRIIKFFFMNFQNMNLFPILFFFFEQGNLFYERVFSTKPLQNRDFIIAQFLLRKFLKKMADISCFWKITALKSHMICYNWTLIHEKIRAEIA